MNPDYKLHHFYYDDYVYGLVPPRKSPPPKPEREPQKCTCSIMQGCSCGVMEAEMRAKGFKRGPKFGAEKWVRI